VAESKIAIAGLLVFLACGLMASSAQAQCLPPPGESSGDCSGDGQLTMLDVARISVYLCELDGQSPDSFPVCPSSIQDLRLSPDSCGLAGPERLLVEEYGDVDGNCLIDWWDYIYLVNFLFCSGPEPVSGLSVSEVSPEFCYWPGSSVPNGRLVDIAGSSSMNWTIDDTISWVEVDQVAGTGPASVTISLVGIESFAPGLYQSTLVANDGDTLSPGQVDIVVSLNVGDFSFSPPGLTFAYTRQGQLPASQRVAFLGSTGLPWWLENLPDGVTIDLTMGTIGDSVTFGFDASDVGLLPDGPSSATIPFLFGCDSVPLASGSIPVDFEIFTFDANPLTLDFSYTIGDPLPPPQPVVFTGAAEYWSLVGNGSYIQLNTNNGSSFPDTVRISLTTNVIGLSAGSYSDSFGVQGGAIASPRYLEVDVNITIMEPAASFLVSPDTLLFTHELGDPLPPAQQISLSGDAGNQWQSLSSPAYVNLSANSGVVPDAIDVSPLPGIDMLLKGNYSEWLLFEAGDSISVEQDSVLIELTVTSALPDTLEIGANWMGFYYEQGSTVPGGQYLHLNGPYATTWALDLAAPWLEADKTTGTFPDSILITPVDLDRLDPGVYQGGLSITSAGRDNSTRYVNLSLHVDPSVEVGSDVTLAGTVDSLPIYISHDTIAGFFIPLSYARSETLQSRSPAPGIAPKSAGITFTSVRLNPYYEINPATLQPTGATVEIDTATQILIVNCPLQKPPLPPPDTTSSARYLAMAYYTTTPTATNQVVYVEPTFVPCPDNGATTPDSSCSVHFILPDGSLYEPNVEVGEIAIVSDDPATTPTGLLEVDQDVLGLEPGQDVTEIAVTQIGDFGLPFTVTVVGTGVSVSPSSGTTPAIIQILTDTCWDDGGCLDTVIINSGDALNTVVIEISREQYVPSAFELTLSSGWNLVSWNVATASAGIEDVLGGILPDVAMVLGFDQGGLTYDPNLPHFSTLKTVNNHSGYWIRIRDGVSPVLSIVGDPLPVGTPIPLTEGWNLVSYLPDAPLAPDQAFANLEVNAIDWAYGTDLNRGIVVYQPGSAFNSMLEMYPGHGYWLRTTIGQELIYPDGTSDGAGASSRSVRPSTSLGHGGVTVTPTWIDLFCRQVLLDGRAVADGAVITAVTAANGAVIGCDTVWQGGFGFMPVYAGYGSPLEPGAEFRLNIDGVPTRETFTWHTYGELVEVRALTTESGGQGALPARFALHDVYPNPFNMSAVVAYDLPQAAHVKIAVYNVLGQQVALIFEGDQPPGTYQLHWRAVSDAGSELASGVYFIHFEAGEYTESKKILLIK